MLVKYEYSTENSPESAGNHAEGERNISEVQTEVYVFIHSTFRISHYVDWGKYTECTVLIFDWDFPVKC